MNLANLPGEDDENSPHGRHSGSRGAVGVGGNSEENSSLVPTNIILFISV